MRRDGQRDHDVKAKGKAVVDSLLVSDSGLPCLRLGTRTPYTSVALRFLYTFDNCAYYGTQNGARCATRSSGNSKEGIGVLSGYIFV